jgi:hypothetical protein
MLLLLAEPDQRLAALTILISMPRKIPASPRSRASKSALISAFVLSTCAPHVSWTAAKKYALFQFLFNSTCNDVVLLSLDGCCVCDAI